MKKNIKKELLEMKYLFGYERGRVISEQTSVPMEEDNNLEYHGVVDTHGLYRDNGQRKSR